MITENFTLVNKLFAIVDGGLSMDMIFSLIKLILVMDI